MAAPKNRWNMGTPDIGASFDDGFVSPWNSNTRNFSDFETIATIPSTSKPATMAGQMDGDENTTFSSGGGRRR